MLAPAVAAVDAVVIVPKKKKATGKRLPQMDAAEITAATFAFFEAAERQQQQNTLDIDTYARGRFADHLELVINDVDQADFVERRVGKSPSRLWTLELSKAERAVGVSFVPYIKKVISTCRNTYTPLYKSFLKGGKLPSGTTEKDAIIYMLACLWRAHLQKGADAVGIDLDGDEAEAETEAPALVPAPAAATAAPVVAPVAAPAVAAPAQVAPDLANPLSSGFAELQATDLGFDRAAAAPPAAAVATANAPAKPMPPNWQPKEFQVWLTFGPLSMGRKEPMICIPEGGSDLCPCPNREEQRKKMLNLAPDLPSTPSDSTSYSTDTTGKGTRSKQMGTASNTQYRAMLMATFAQALSIHSAETIAAVSRIECIKFELKYGAPDDAQKGELMSEFRELKVVVARPLPKAPDLNQAPGLDSLAKTPVKPSVVQVSSPPAVATVVPPEPATARELQADMEAALQAVVAPPQQDTWAEIVQEIDALDSEENKRQRLVESAV